MKPVLCVGAVVVRDGRLLVIKRGQPPGEGLWSVPGGRLEMGELLSAGAVRELQEETGLSGVAGDLCGIAERINPGAHLVIHDFWITVSGDQEPVAGDDAADVAFVTPEELAGLPTVPLLHEFLADHNVWPQGSEADQA